MNLNEMSKRAYENSKAHGFHDGENSGDHNVLGTKLALIHSEVSEALEEVRMSKSLNELCAPAFESRPGEPVAKPVGFLSELADIIIRVGDLAASVGAAHMLDEMVRLKMEYNESRPFRHGGKRC